MVAIGIVLGAGAGVPAAGADAGVRVSASPPGWRVEHYFGACQSDGVQSVSATGTHDAWATGQEFRFQCDRPGLLISRWNGKSWRDLTPPPGFAGLAADAQGTSVAALSASYAWVFVIRALYPPSEPFGSVALLWQAGRWRHFGLAANVQISSSAVFSPSNAWAIGLRSGSRYAARFNGKRWRQVPIPVLPEEAAFAAPRNIWVVGRLADRQRSLALAHWTGRWHVDRLPQGIAPSGGNGGFVDDPWVVSDGSKGAWVALTIFRNGFGNNMGGALLHWTGILWLDFKVPMPTLGLGPLSRDGNGGVWIASSASTSPVSCPSCDINAMFDYRNGTWSKGQIKVPGLSVTAMRLIPGTTSVWASGTGAAVPGGQGDTVGVMLKYGP
jgi:hypothetical protein